MAERTHLLWVCTDCMFTHANGEASDDPSYTPDREPLCLIGPGETVTLGMTWEKHAEDCPNRAAHSFEDECDCEHVTFSWSPCQGCGSTLGGDRFAMTLWSDE